MATEAIQKKDTTATLADLLRQKKDSIAQLVPEHLAPERLMRVAVNCVSKTPDLQMCSVQSLLHCVLAAAELGLEPGGALGQFYLVPFKGVATPIIGYRGLLELARRSGQISSIRAVVVYAKDTFKLTEGIEQTIVHERHLGGDPGPLVYVYAVAKLKDGSVQVEVMSKAQVDAIRARSRSGSGERSPWNTDYEEMAKKTVFRRLAKWLPLSSERFEKALELDNGDYVDGEVVAEQVASEVTNIKERVKRKMLIKDEPAPASLPEDAPATEEVTPPDGPA